MQWRPVMLNANEKMNPNVNGSPVQLLHEASFEAEVLHSKEPVLVVFETPWSQPCQILESVVQELARACEGKLRVIKVNADECLGLSLCYDIQSIPTLIYFVAGKPVVRILGTATKEAILEKLRPFVN